jgi:hypothetical protein
VARRWLSWNGNTLAIVVWDEGK